MRSLVISDGTTSETIGKLIKDENFGTTLNVSSSQECSHILSKEKVDLVFIDSQKLQLREWIEVFKVHNSGFQIILLSNTDCFNSVKKTHLTETNFFFINKPIKRLQVIPILKLIEINLSLFYLVSEFKNKITELHNLNNRNKEMLLSLTSSDIEVLKLLNQGYTHAQVSEKMYLSLDTLKSQTKRIRKKLDVNKTIDGVKMARQLES